jgi:PPK2 family polyphosphate:nucleotide phosphotransferase
MMHVVENRYWVKPGNKISLADYDPADTHGLKKQEAQEELAALQAKLNELQTLLYATEKYSLLIVLQGMDTGGKDGVIKHVIGAFNPQGCQVTNFKVPTSEELAHDFLWRIHKATPRKGMVGIFNRSHYEDVLVVRVEELVPESVWKKRYAAINAWEQLLADSGTVIVKFFLHISKEEQRRRLEDRLHDPTEQWKFRVGDLKAREKWDAYMAAYEDALNKCSTEYAPWYIIPADKKWFRNLLVSRILVETLSALKLEWPPLEPEAEGITII